MTPILLSLKVQATLQVLNAMLLACASISSEEAVASMARLLQAGAVPDTWAPKWQLGMHMLKAPRAEHLAKMIR